MVNCGGFFTHNSLTMAIWNWLWKAAMGQEAEGKAA